MCDGTGRVAGGGRGCEHRDKKGFTVALEKRLAEPAIAVIIGVVVAVVVVVAVIALNARSRSGVRGHRTGSNNYGVE